MFVKNCTLRRVPTEEPMDSWAYNYGEEAKFGVLIVTNPNEVDEYNVTVELNLRYGSSIGHVDEAQIKIKQGFRFIWIPLSLTIGSKDIFARSNDLPESKGVIKVVISRKVKQHKISDDSIGFKESFKTLVGKISNRDKASDNHLIIYQNLLISQTLILKTKVVNGIHLLVMENISKHKCVVTKVKSDYETLFSHSLQLLPTERFSLILDSRKIKSDCLWVNWSLDIFDNNTIHHLWSPVQIILTQPNKLSIMCSNVSIINGLAIIDIMIYNNTIDDMDVQLFMEHNDSLVALQENYVVGLVKCMGKGGCRVEFIIVRHGTQQLPNIKLVDKLGNKSYMLSGVIFQL